MSEGGGGAPWWASFRMLTAVAIAQAAVLVPFHYLATEDGPTNIASAHIITSYPGPYRQYLELDFFPKFDMLWQLLLSLMVRLMPALVAERIMVVALVIALPLAGWYAARAVRPDGGPVAFLLLPLSIGYFQHAGYDSFCVGLVLFLVTVGWWLRHRDDGGVRPYVVLIVLLVLTYLAHLVALAMTVGLLAVVTAWEMFTNSDRRRGSRRLVMLGVGTIPVIVLVAIYATRRTSVSGTSRLGLKALAQDLVTLRPALASMARLEVGPSLLIGLTVIGLAAFTLWCYAPRLLRDPSHAWLVATLAAVAVYFIAPDSIGDGGQISARLILFVVMAAVMWFAWFDYGRRVLAVIVALSLVATAGLTVLHVPKYVGFNRDIGEFTSVTDQMPNGSTVLALNFVQAQDSTSGLTSSKWTRPVIQDLGYVVADRNVVDLSHFDGGLSYFITQFRDDVNPFHFIGFDRNWLADSPPHVNILDYETKTGGKGKIDYIVTWGEDQATDATRSSPLYDDVRSQLASGYRLVATSSRGHAKLYQRSS